MGYSHVLVYTSPPTWGPYGPCVGLSCSHSPTTTSGGPTWICLVGLHILPMGFRFHLAWFKWLTIQTEPCILKPVINSSQSLPEIFFSSFESLLHLEYQDAVFNSSARVSVIDLIPLVRGERGAGLLVNWGRSVFWNLFRKRKVPLLTDTAF